MATEIRPASCVFGSLVLQEKTAVVHALKKKKKKKRNFRAGCLSFIAQQEGSMIVLRHPSPRRLRRHKIHDSSSRFTTRHHGWWPPPQIHAQATTNGTPTKRKAGLMSGALHPTDKPFLQQPQLVHTKRENSDSAVATAQRIILAIPGTKNDTPGKHTERGEGKRRLEKRQQTTD